MNCPLLNDDIMYYLKGHIYINDYDKMKNVSVKYRDLFDLNPILRTEQFIISNNKPAIHNSKNVFLPLNSNSNAK